MHGNERTPRSDEPSIADLMKVITQLGQRVEDIARNQDGGSAKRSLDTSSKKRTHNADRAEQAATAPQPEPPPPPPDPRSKQLPFEARIRAALEDAFLDTAGLARALGESQDVVARELETLQRQEKVANVGSEDFQSWFWRPGNSITHQELMTAIIRLISHQPLPVHVLLRATGATTRQVDNALVDIRRAHQVWDVSTQGRRKCYFIMPPNAKDARLPARRAPKTVK